MRSFFFWTIYTLYDLNVWNILEIYEKKIFHSSMTCDKVTSCSRYIIDSYLSVLFSKVWVLIFSKIRRWYLLSFNIRNMRKGAQMQVWCLMLLSHCVLVFNQINWRNTFVKLYVFREAVQYDILIHWFIFCLLVLVEGLNARSAPIFVEFDSRSVSRSALWTWVLRH